MIQTNRDTIWGKIIKLWRKLKYSLMMQYLICYHGLEKPLRTTPIHKITDKKLKSMSRISGKDVRISHNFNTEQGCPMNMIRNKKTGVVVVVPGYTSDINNCRYSEDKSNYELVESAIK